MYGVRLLRRRPVQVAALSTVAIVVLAFRGLQFLGLTHEIQWGYDFSAYWVAAWRLLYGLSPYQADQLAGLYSPQQQFLYLYPPPLAVAVTPLAWLFPPTPSDLVDPAAPYRAAAWIWTSLGALVLIAATLALWRSERLGERFPILAGRGRWLLVAAVFAFPPVVGELVLGNVHLLLLGLLTLAWLGVRRGDARGDWVAGIAVAAATLIKVFPGVVIVWFLLTRRYRAALGAVVGAAAIALVALPITGIEPWLQYPTVLANLGPPVDLRDTLAPTVWLSTAVGFTAARIAVTVIGLAILAWAAMRAGGWGYAEGASAAADAGVAADAGDDSRDTARSFAIAVTVSVLIAPALYHHYLALLVLPFLLALSSGVSLGWIAAAYLLMWGGEQSALGDLSWIVNRLLPTAGAVLLLLGLLASRGRALAAVRR